MSGHSKWATIRRKKEKTDAARGRVFTRLIKEISISARMGGGDIEGNPRLRTAVAAAKAANMPQDNIIRAIKKGTGELPGVSYEERTYEGYGPGGCAILIETLTDNVNRTTPEIRHLFSKYGGNLAETNAVAFMFARKAQIELEANGVDEDQIMEKALDSGADDVYNEEDDTFIITAEPNSLASLSEAFSSLDVNIIRAEVVMVPKSTVDITEKHVKSLLKLMDLLDEHDDIQKVYSNFDINPSLLENLDI